MTTAFPDKRTAIIETALRLFADRGFHGTPTALVAKEAGVATGTLFHHFATKVALVNSIFSHVKTHWWRYVSSEFPLTGSVPQQAEYTFKRSVLWGVHHTAYYRFMELFATSPYLTLDTAQETMDKLDFVVQLLDAGQRDGIFRTVDPFLMFNVIQGIVREAIRTIVNNESEQNRLLHEAFLMAWAAIVAPENQD